MSRESRRRALRVLGAAGLVAILASCGKGITDPTCELCDEMRLRTDRETYNPKSLIRFTISNRTSTDLHYDWCSVIAVGRNVDTRPFETYYRVHARCGAGAGIADVVANMRTLAPGAIARDSVTLTASSYQGEYQIQLWPVELNGTVLPGGPAISNSFNVRPTAAP